MEIDTAQHHIRRTCRPDPPGDPRPAGHREATVNELAEPFEITLQAVSKHLKVLERAGLISRGRDAQYRPCRLESAPLDSAIDWVEEHRQVWQQRLDRLETHLRNIQQPQKENRISERHISKDPASSPSSAHTTRRASWCSNA